MVAGERERWGVEPGIPNREKRREEREKLLDEERWEKKGQKKNRPSMHGSISPFKNMLETFSECGWEVPT